MSDRYQTKNVTGLVKRVDRSGSFEAVIATLNVIDSDGDIIVAGAFSDATVAVLPAHDSRSIPLGKAKMEDRGNTAVAVGQFNLDIQAAKDWHNAILFDLKTGRSIQEWSFAFRILDSEIETRDGEEVRILKKMDVMEVSPVLRGAGVGTRTIAAKDQSGDDFGLVIDEFEDSVADLSRLLRGASPDQLRSVRPVVGPVLSNVSRFLGEMIGGKSTSDTDIGRRLHLRFQKSESRILAGGVAWCEDDFLKHEPEDSRYKYQFCEVGTQKAAAANQFAAMVAKRLGIESPTIKFFRPTEGKSDFAHEKKIHGLAFCGEKQDGNLLIYVEDLPIDEMIGTIAHEVRHHYQFEKGWDMGDENLVEGDAHNYGSLVKAEFGLPGYADIIVSEGSPPNQYDSVGPLSSLFHFSKSSGEIHQATGYGPWPCWRFFGTVSNLPR